MQCEAVVQRKLERVKRWRSEDAEDIGFVCRRWVEAVAASLIERRLPVKMSLVKGIGRCASRRTREDEPRSSEQVTESVANTSSRRLILYWKVYCLACGGEYACKETCGLWRALSLQLAITR